MTAAGLRVSLPFPPAELNPNNKNGRHWGMTNGVKAQYQRECWALTMEQFGTGGLLMSGDIPLRPTFAKTDRRRVDADNLLSSAKAGLDGFAAALKVDDSRFEPVTVRRLYGQAKAALIVEILNAEAVS